MSAQDRLRTTLAAVGFAIAMVLLGLMNPNAAPGHTGCGLVCEARIAAPATGFAPR